MPFSQESLPDGADYALSFHHPSIEGLYFEVRTQVMGFGDPYTLQDSDEVFQDVVDALAVAGMVFNGPPAATRPAMRTCTPTP
jgi:hypothetical protein